MRRHHLVIVIVIQRYVVIDFPGLDALWIFLGRRGNLLGWSLLFEMLVFPGWRRERKWDFMDGSLLPDGPRDPLGG